MKLLSFFLALFLLTGCQQYEENAHLPPPNIHPLLGRRYGSGKTLLCLSGRRKRRSISAITRRIWSALRQRG